MHRAQCVPFCTLSHSRKISSPPRQLPEFRFTLQILSSAVLGAPEGVTRRKSEPSEVSRVPPRRCHSHAQQSYIISQFADHTSADHSYPLFTPTNSEIASCCVERSSRQRNRVSRAVLSFPDLTVKGDNLTRHTISFCFISTLARSPSLLTPVYTGFQSLGALKPFYF